MFVAAVQSSNLPIALGAVEECVAGADLANGLCWAWAGRTEARTSRVVSI